MRKRIKIFSLICLVLGISWVLMLKSPEERVREFVDKNSKILEEKIELNEPIPVEMQGKYYNEWSGEQDMVEFILFTRGNSYYGCYYSPDDVPLPFQNAEGIPVEKNALLKSMKITRL